MVDDHSRSIVHVVHLFMSIKRRSTNRIVPRFMNLDESLINELNTTLELGQKLHVPLDLAIKPCHQSPR